MRPELTITNFSKKLDANLDTRFHPGYRDSRSREVMQALRDIVGESAWSSDLLDRRDIATLHKLIEKRKLGISVTEDYEGHQNQYWLGEMVKQTGQDFGMRESDFDGKLANMRIVNNLIDTSNIGAIKSVNLENLVGSYRGSRCDTRLLDEALVQPISPIVASQLARAPKVMTGPKPKPRPKPEPEVRSRATAEPKSTGFEKHWDALQAHCSTIEDLQADSITQFIADGPKTALNLDKETFADKMKTARRSLDWLGVDSKPAQKALDGLEQAHHKYHEKRELGGVSRT